MPVEMGMRVRMCGALLLSAVLLPSGAQAQISLDSATRAYLEGEWVVMSGTPVGDPCINSNQSEENWESYEIEFLRSGGSFRINDMVDANWRDKIASADKRENTISMVLGENHFKDVRLVPQSSNRMRWSETIGNTTNRKFVTGMAYRCTKAQHDVTSKLNASTITRLSLSHSGEVYFVESNGDPKQCAGRARSYLHFELIGPTHYWVWRYGDTVSDQLIEVRKAVENRTGVILSVHTQSGDSDIHVTWQDETHIFVQPWGHSYRRCSS